MEEPECWELLEMLRSIGKEAGIGCVHLLLPEQPRHWRGPRRWSSRHLNVHSCFEALQLHASAFGFPLCDAMLAAAGCYVRCTRSMLPTSSWPSGASGYALLDSCCTHDPLLCDMKQHLHMPAWPNRAHRSARQLGNLQAPRPVSAAGV